LSTSRAAVDLKVDHGAALGKRIAQRAGVNLE
jgi:hypothetical protein